MSVRQAFMAATAATALCVRNCKHRNLCFPLLLPPAVTVARIIPAATDTQDLASWLGVTELSSTASFPAAMSAFRDTLARVEAASAARSMVDGDTAQLSSAIKAAVVRAEDARLLGDVAGLKRAHKRLADLNRDMWLEHGRRVANQQELLAGLKGINSMIQAAAGLRVGPAQAKVVAACRAAIKANNLQSLEKVCLAARE